MSARHVTAASFAILWAVWSSFVGLPPSSGAQETSAEHRIDAVFAEWNRPDAPGCGVGVSRNGAITFERGYGMADLDAKIPISPATVFHVASISKQFTAMSILLLAQRWRLSLDDEVGKHIPGWAEQEGGVTIRHLLSHTRGLRDAFQLLALVPSRDDGADLNESIVRILARQRGLNFPPGAEFQYSNGGYVVLAHIVKRVSGQSLRAFADANIFKPLGMTQTHVHDDPAMTVPNRAVGYRPSADGVRPIPHADLGRLVGNGEGDSVELIAVDLNRFVIPGTSFVFDFINDATGQTREVHITGEGPKPAVLRKVTPFLPSVADLRALAGEYRSAELDVTYRVMVRDSRLVVRISGRSDGVLEPIVPDTFTGGVFDTLTFMRDARGRVVAAVLKSSGVRHLRFERIRAALPRV